MNYLADSPHVCSGGKCFCHSFSIPKEFEDGVGKKAFALSLPLALTSIALCCIFFDLQEILLIVFFLLGTHELKIVRHRRIYIARWLKERANCVREAREIALRDTSSDSKLMLVYILHTEHSMGC
jgi:hypothetical protein